MIKSYKEIIDLIPVGYLKHSSLGPDNEIFDVLNSFKLSGNCVEIGTYKGIGASILAQYFECVYTFDVKRSADTKFIFDSLGVSSKIIYSVCFDREEIYNKLNSFIKSGIKFTSGFIDAYHDYNNVKFDFEMLFSIGVSWILFHDVQNSGINKFITEIRADIVSRNLAVWMK